MFRKKTDLTESDVKRLVRDELEKHRVNFESQADREISRISQEIEKTSVDKIDRVVHRNLSLRDKRYDHMMEKFQEIKKIITCSHSDVTFVLQGRFDGDPSYMKECSYCGYKLGTCSERQKLSYEYDEKASELAKLKAVLGQINDA